MFNDAIDVLQNKDISKALKYVEQKINDDDITALELAAAFLRLNMGEEAKEIEKVEYKTSGKGCFQREHIIILINLQAQERMVNLINYQHRINQIKRRKMTVAINLAKMISLEEQIKNNASHLHDKVACK